MTMIPTDARKQLLDFIIDHQEGGWTLTQVSGDNDGGWTYAGVTCKTFTAWCNAIGDTRFYPYTYNTMKAVEVPAVQDVIYEIYSKKYCAPIQLDDLPRILKGPVLSCAINCGAETAIRILQKVADVPQDGEMGSRTMAAITVANNRINSFLFEKFLREWMRYYIRLITQEDEFEGFKKAKFLEGWFNRVETWRSWENTF